MIDPEWQGAGLGRLLHARTVEYARGHGVRGLTADVLVENAAMLRVFRRGDHGLSVTTSAGVHEVRMLFAADAGEV
jgi:GNAT superfamily N-acetyltransferase